MRRVAFALTLGVSSTLLVGFGTAPTPAIAATTYSAPFRTAINDLPTAAESRTGYDRDLFRHWVDADGDGCDTRKEVLIAEAWDSGASRWTSTQRQSFANDFGDYRALVGVTDSLNQSKGDQDPTTWMPTYDKCRYLREWVAVKLRWRLTVDSTEKSALKSKSASCTNVTITVTRAI